MVRAALLLAALTLLMTMPVAASAGSLFASGVVDPPFTIWTMASQVHELETNPSQFFDANIFYPERATHAYAPLNLASMLAQLPVLVSSRNPILTYNFAYLFALWLIGFGTFLFARKTRSAGSWGYRLGTPRGVFDICGCYQTQTVSEKALSRNAG